jgi:hypothetical protein
MECAWRSTPYTIGDLTITFSSTNEVNPVASVAWNGSGSVPLFTVNGGELTFKCVDVFTGIFLF